MFELTLEGRQRISQNDVVRQALPELGSGDREGSTADCIDTLRGGTTRQYCWSQQNATLVDHGRSATRDTDEWTETRLGDTQDQGTSEQEACTACAVGPATSEG